MKLGFCRLSLLFVAVTGMLLTGCLFKPATVSTRHYILTPISANQRAPAATVATDQLSVGIRFVKMPSYLLRDSMAVRNRTNEIEYLEGARWAERLDECFQRILAANLSQLLSSASIYPADWGRYQVMVSLFINVQQFDVDTDGRGTLIAQWRIAAPDSAVPLKVGQARLNLMGASPHGNPECVAATLSDLSAEFSRELAQFIRESVKSSPSLIQSNRSKSADQ